MIEQLWNKTVLAGLLFTGLATYLAFSVCREHLHIRSLGGRAPIIWGKLPFGLDIVYISTGYLARDDDLSFWGWLYARLPSGRSKTVEFTLARQRFIFTADPENVKAILATQFEEYGKGEPFHQDWQAFLGDSIFTTDGKKWYDSRSLLRPQFIKARVSDLEVFEEHVTQLIGLVGGHGEEFDISGLFYRYTLDVSVDFLLGVKIGSLNNPRTEFSQAFAEVQRVQSLITRMGPFKIFQPRGSYHAGLNKINEFLNPLIERTLLLTPAELEEKTKSSEGYTFLHAIAGFTRDRNLIRDQILAVLLAGRDTTAGTLSFLFQELARNPHVLAKLRAEMSARLGPHQRPAYEDLKNMPYLQHTLNETLRLYPSVAVNVRAALHNTTIPRGGGPDGLSPVGVLKDTPVAYSTIFMQRDPSLYPTPSPEFPPVNEFHPERWDHWIPKSWTYIPFNAGPRICIGQNFALTQMSYTVVRIFQHFERLEKRFEDELQLLRTEVVMSPANGVMVAFWEEGAGPQEAKGRMGDKD